MTAAIEAYRISVDLMLGGDLADGVQSLIPGLERVTALVDSANASAAGLAKSMRSIGNAAGGISKTAEALRGMNEAMHQVNSAVHEFKTNGGMPGFAVPTGSGSHITPGGMPLALPAPAGHGAPHISAPGGALVTVPNFTMGGGDGGGGHGGGDASFAEEGEGRIPLNMRGPRAAGGGGGGHTHTAFDGVIPALVTGEFLNQIFHASFDASAKEAELLTNGWSPDRVKAARALAQQVQVSTPGATIGGGLEIMKDLGSLFRKADGTPETEAAMAALPGYSRDALVLGPNGINELFSAARAGDLKGELSKPGTEDIDPEKFGRFVHNVVLAYVTTGGRVTPAMVLQNLKTGGVPAALMDDKEFFGANLAMIEGLGPQAASALSGFNRQFGAGRMGEGIAKELEGVFPQLHGHWHSVGMGQVMVDPGAMGDPEQLAKSPYEFIRNTIMPGIDKLIEKRFPDFQNWDADKKLVYESQEGSRIASSVTGSKQIVEVMRLWPQMQREQAAFENTQKTDPYQTLVANNPQFQGRAMMAAANAFEIAAGQVAQGPAIEALNNITSWLNAMAKWAGEHPEGMKAALEGLSFGILALGAEKVGLALASLGGGGKGGLFALAGGILALSGALDKMPGWLVDAAKGAAVGGYFGGTAGAVAGAVGGALWNQSPGGVLDMTPGEAWDHWQNSSKGVASPPATVQKQSYTVPMQQPTAQVHNITFKVDGRTLAKIVTEHQADMIGQQVYGTIRPDPSAHPQYGAHLVET